MNKTMLTSSIFALLIFTACAISKKEKERYEKLIETEGTSAELVTTSDAPNAEMLSSYETRAIQKLEDFYDYLHLLANDSYSESMQEEIIVAAMDLFYDPTVEVIPQASASQESVTLAEFLENVSKKADPSLYAIDKVAVSQPLTRFANGHYNGELQFVLTANGAQGSVSVQKTAPFCLRKVEKSIDNTIIEVWQVALESVR